MTTHVKRVRSTVKKGVDSELGRLTIIIGPNGSGKTSHVNSIELALGGFVTDLVGRTVTKKAGDLILLANNGKLLESHVELSDRQIASFYSVATSTGAKRPEMQKPSMKAAFPFLEVKENLTASAAKSRLYLMRNFSGFGADREEILSRFPLSAKEAYNKLAPQFSGSEIDKLLAVISHLNDSVRKDRAEAKTRQSVLDETTMRLGPEPTSAEIEVLKGKEQEALDAFTEWRDKGENTPRPEEIGYAHQSAVMAAKLLVEAEAELDKCVTAVNLSPSVSPQQQQIVHLRDSVIHMAKLHHDMGLKACMVCESNGSPDFGIRAERLTEVNKKMSEALMWHRRKEDVETTINNKLRPDAEEALKAWQVLSQKGGENANIIQSEIGERRRAYNMANDHRVDKERIRNQWAEARILKDRIEEGLEAAEKAKFLSKSCQDAVVSILRSACDAFTEKVQSFLPSTDTFRLEIDSKSDSCRFGLVTKEGNLNTALSGAEWARVMLAIGCAVAKPEDLNIFIPEERAFDSKTLGAVMRGLENAPGQVILTSPIAPRKGAYLDKWTVIKLD